MKESRTFHKILGILFITFGIIFYLTPVPGTTILIILGFVFIIGKKRTLYFFNEFLSKKVFKLLKIRKIIKKI